MPPSINPARETVRIYNRDPKLRQLTFHLAKTFEKTSQRLRRGALQLSVCIEPGTFFDTCQKLDVDVAEAERILAASPDVKRLQNTTQIEVLHHPLRPRERAMREAAERQRLAAQAATDAMIPPENDQAVGVGVDLELAGLSSDTPRAIRPRPAAVLSTPAHESTPRPEAVAPLDLSPEGAMIRALAEPSVAPTTPTSPTVATLPATTAVEVEDEAELEAEAEVDVAGVAGVVVEGTVDDVVSPSMDWATDKLKAYAAEHNIDIGLANSKTQILKRIRKAGGA